MAQQNQVFEYSGTELISRDEAKRYLRVEFSDDDDYIDELIKIARLQILRDTNQPVVQTQIKEFFTTWPSGNLCRLSYSGKTSSHTVVYSDPDNVKITMTEGTDYRITTNAGLPVVQFYNTYNTADRQDALTIDYKVEPNNPDTVRTLKVAMFMLIQHFYDNRSPVSFLKVDELPLGYKYLVNQFKNYKW